MRAISASVEQLDGQLRGVDERFAALEGRLDALDAAMGEARGTARETLAAAQKLDAAMTGARERLESAEAATITNCYEIAQMKRRL